MRMCAKSSLITKSRNVSEDGTFSLYSSFPFSFFFNNGPVDHSSLNGLKIDNDGSGYKKCIDSYDPKIVMFELKGNFMSGCVDFSRGVASNYTCEID